MLLGYRLAVPRMGRGDGGSCMGDLRILLLSDGRPGHYHLAEGIISAIARSRSVRTCRLEVRRPRWMPGRVLSTLVNRGVPPALLLRTIYGVARDGLPGADLVVSAGGDTLGANICIARVLGVPNIFYGSLRRYRADDFALALTSYARRAVHPRIVMSLKPSKLDPDVLGLPPARRAGTSPAVCGLLLGGDAGGFTYTSQDWAQMLALVRGTHAAYGTRWIVSNSRRTPAAASEAFADLAGHANGPCMAFIDVRSAGAGTLASLFAGAGGVAVTADSSSMVSEAVWSRRPVVALMPRRGQFTPDEQSYRNYLEEQGWCASLALAEANPARFAQALDRCRPLVQNPLDHLAALISSRIPDISAQTN